MKIRPEQMAAFGADRVDQLVAEAALMIHGRYPEIALTRTPEELDTLVRETIREGVGLGFESEAGALRYIALRLEFRGDLWGAPEWQWARDILRDPRLREEQKLARIDHLAYGGDKPGDMD
ncbi:MAG: hypothetical protein R3B70_48880 [Polyangiaceae bacterium]